MPLALAAPTHIKTVTTADDGLYRSITSFAQHTAWLQGAMKIYTVGAIVLLCVMGVYAWWSARSRADRTAMVAVVWLALGTVISIGTGLGLKQVFQENRPCQAIHVATVEACPGPMDYSFPSDHTIMAVALAVGLWIVSRKLGIIAVVLAVVEGFSRVYLGQHYPHDVLAAAIVSTAILLGGWLLLRRPLTRVIAGLEATPLRPLLTGAPVNAAPINAAAIETASIDTAPIDTAPAGTGPIDTAPAAANADAAAADAAGGSIQP